MSIHLIFDLLAALASVSLTVLLARGPLAEGLARVERIGWPWYAAFLIGAVWGAFALGTLNLVSSGTPGIGRSILGALIGAILMVEQSSLSDPDVQKLAKEIIDAQNKEINFMKSKIKELESK